MASTDIIIHDKKDNVGVVVIEKIKPNQDYNCWIIENDSSAKIKSISEIPLGHKIAMIDFNEGKRINNNSGNFLGIKINYTPDWFVISDIDKYSVENQI